ncbi:MAG TPA: hypothetical protein VE944_16975 [Nostoc sp.]|uniref:hypothetical protein n=1 Tax=Nostoc sp. TaxID=1180 RepID=UPI002D4ADF83|nr:hypothetical protein [Nostoc sp.]HYX16025.1 hypothetical protein [Nostoc sp.]
MIRSYFSGYISSCKTNTVSPVEHIFIVITLTNALVNNLFAERNDGELNPSFGNIALCNLLEYQGILLPLSVLFYLSISPLLITLIIFTPATLQHCSFMLQVSKPENLATMCSPLATMRGVKKL